MSSFTPITDETSASSPSEDPSITSVLADCLADLPDRTDVEHQLQTFVVQHATHHRPLVLVTSGGTAADLEVHSVRSLDNFSTGTRGAASVEAFLRKGYAVIHLWRRGSASPYGRILSEVLGLPGNQGFSTAAVGKLFVGAGDAEQDEEDRMVQSVLAANADPWLTEPTTAASAAAAAATGGRGVSRTWQQQRNKTSEASPIALHRRIEFSSRLQSALKERQTALQEGRLLTVSYRSIDEYLAKLQLCSVAIQNCQALAMVYLAAAVSDFYIPKADRSEHKIQSSSSSSSDGLTLTLRPVPKVMGLLRSTWAPDAFVCSFKLETDATILRQKAERAVQRYGCHMVVGNLLETRYSQVLVLAPPLEDESGVASAPALVHTWPMQSIVKSKGDPDSLENQLVDTVVEAHFDYISKSCNGTFDKAGAEAVRKAHDELEEQKRRLQRKATWEKVQRIGLEWAGVVAGAMLSYAISTALRNRMGANRNL